MPRERARGQARSRTSRSRALASHARLMGGGACRGAIPSPGVMPSPRKIVKTGLIWRVLNKLGRGRRIA
jgi:hypothetical protein